MGLKESLSVMMVIVVTLLKGLLRVVTPLDSILGASGLNTRKWFGFHQRDCCGSGLKVVGCWLYISSFRVAPCGCVCCLFVVSLVDHVDLKANEWLRRLHRWWF